MSYLSSLNTQTSVRQRSLMNQVYVWMTAGLLVSGAVAAYTANSPALLGLIFGSPFAFFGLIIAELALVIGLGSAIGRLSPALPRRCSSSTRHPMV